MLDIDYMSFDVECPKCKFKLEVLFKDARLRDVLICRGCKSNIQLDDHMNECRKARKQLEAAFRELNQSLSSLSQTINIRF